MKKIAFVFSLILVALCVEAAPTITSTSRIVLQAAGKADKPLNFAMGPSWSDAVDNGFDSEDVNDGLYVIKGATHYMRWASNAYSKNLLLGFKADNQNTTYTLHFENFTGESYEIFDKLMNETIVVNGSTADYVFTIDASLRNTNINDRFVINYEEEVDEGDLEICFNENGDNKLVIKNNPYSGKIAVKDANGDDVTGSPFNRQATKPTPQSIDLSALTPGKYTVVIGGHNYIIIR